MPGAVPERERSAGAGRDPAARPGQRRSLLGTSPPLRQMTETRTAATTPRTPTHPSSTATAPGPCRCFCISRSTLAAHSGRHLTEGTALAQLRPQFIVPSPGRGARPIPRRDMGQMAGTASPAAPPRQRDPRPAAREVGSGAGAPHAGQPLPSLPRRTRAAPAVRRAAAANTYPESFPIFTKLNTSIHAAG